MIQIDRAMMRSYLDGWSKVLRWILGPIVTFAALAAYHRPETAIELAMMLAALFAVAALAVCLPPLLQLLWASIRVAMRPAVVRAFKFGRRPQ